MIVNTDLDELVIQLEETIGTSPHSRETIKDFFQRAVQKSVDGLTQQEAMDIAVAKCFEQGEKKPVIEMKSAEESLGIDSDTYNKIVDECIYGKQKSTDKVEPKFKVGDWIITNKNHIWYVDETPETTSYLYRLINQYGKVEVAEFEVVDKKARLWTIQDAKDGDVISWDDSKCIAIFKNIYDEDSFNSYGFVGGCTGTFESRMSYHDIEGAHPATKEQHNLLFQKMKEAGYEWDAEKKELKKVGQKPAWSEEDDIMAHDIDYALRGQIIYPISKLQSMSIWIDNLKYRIQSQQEWSEEDEAILIEITRLLKNPALYEACPNLREESVDWLKSLKERYTWKPSGEQIEAFEHFVRSIGESGYASPYDNNTKLLYSLLEQLKKLKE